MILRFDASPSRNAGFTLFEMLVSLTILSLVLAVGTSAIKGPSPVLLLHREATEIQKKAAVLRNEVVRNHELKIMDFANETCESGRNRTVFFPDGSASGPDLCLSNGNSKIRLELMPLLGRYVIVQDL